MLTAESRSHHVKPAKIDRPRSEMMPYQPGQVDLRFESNRRADEKQCSQYGADKFSSYTPHGIDTSLAALPTTGLQDSTRSQQHGPLPSHFTVALTLLVTAAAILNHSATRHDTSKQQHQQLNDNLTHATPRGSMQTAACRHCPSITYILVPVSITATITTNTKPHPPPLPLRSHPSL